MSRKKVIVIVILLNLVIVIAEVFFGIISNSMALIADAIHNLGDVLSIIIALIAIVYSEKKATREMTYGYIRSEMMAGFINSFFLLLTMIYILYESVLKIIKPEQVNGFYMIAVAGIALIANAFSAGLLRTGEGKKLQYNHSNEDKSCREDGDFHHNDMNIKTAYFHMLSDAGISIGVVIGGAVIYFFRIYIIDPVFSIVFSVYILFESFKILRATFFSLLDVAPENLPDIEKEILSHEEIISIHDIHISKPSSKDVHFSAHLIFKDEMSLEEIEELLEILRVDLKKYGVTHPLFQPETQKYHNRDPFCQSHCN